MVTAAHTPTYSSPEVFSTASEVIENAQRTTSIRESLNSFIGGLIEGGAVGAAISAAVIGGTYYYLRSAEMFASNPTWQENVARNIGTMLGIQ